MSETEQARIDELGDALMSLFFAARAVVDPVCCCEAERQRRLADLAHHVEHVRWLCEDAGRAVEEGSL